MIKRSDDSKQSNPKKHTANPSEPIDLVKPGDLILISTNPTDINSLRNYKSYPNENRYVLFVAKVDNHIVIETATRTRELIWATELKEILFTRPTPIGWDGDSGPR